MPIQNFTLSEEINSTELFPQHIEENNSIFFHGTSNIFSNHIESFGFIPSFRPLTDYFFEINEIAENLFAFTCNDNQFASFNNAKKDAHEYLTTFTRISFSPNSICAADYSIGDTSGGQGLRHLRNLRREILNLDLSRIPNMSYDISDRQRYYLNNIDTKLNELSNSDGVVYAIQFQTPDILNLTYHNHPRHGVLLCNNHVPPSKIIAKMIIPHATTLPAGIVTQGNTDSKNLLLPQHSTTFIRQIIEYDRNRNDIRDSI